MKMYVLLDSELGYTMYLRVSNLVSARAWIWLRGIRDLTHAGPDL